MLASYSHSSTLQFYLVYRICLFYFWAEQQLSLAMVDVDDSSLQMVLQSTFHPSIHVFISRKCPRNENNSARKMTTLNGIPNRRGRSCVKTSVLHNTKPKHWYYNSATNQTINYHLYTYNRLGVIKNIRRKGKWCKVHVHDRVNSVTGNALGDICN